jgi:hypothetical protein
MSFNLGSKINNVQVGQDFLQPQVATLIASTPSNLNTLSSLASSINNDPNFASNVSTALSYKADASSVYTKSDIDGQFTTLMGGVPPATLNTI